MPTGTLSYLGVFIFKSRDDPNQHIADADGWVESVNSASGGMVQLLPFEPISLLISKRTGSDPGGRLAFYSPLWKLPIRDEGKPPSLRIRR